jgi:hypothetical protein
MSLLNPATAYRRSTSRPRIPVVLPLVRVAVDDTGTLSVTVDDEPLTDQASALSAANCDRSWTASPPNTNQRCASRSTNPTARSSPTSTPPNRRPRLSALRSQSVTNAVPTTDSHR